MDLMVVQLLIALIAAFPFALFAWHGTYQIAMRGGILSPAKRTEYALVAVGGFSMFFFVAWLLSPR